MFRWVHYLVMLTFALATPFSVLAADNALPVWSYDGDETGQDDWGALSKDYAACELGTQQSPIQITYTHASYLPILDFHYHATKTKIRHTAHAMEMEISGAQTLEDDGQIWHLKRIEFHTPGEHTIKDSFYPMEIHLIHENDAHQLLIVAIFVKPGQPLAALQPLIDHLPKKTNEQATLTFDPAIFLPDTHGYYAYPGSLTYPPCTEGVAWRIMKQPISISQSQFAIFAHIIGRNARLTQPVYVRTIEESIP